MRRKRERQADSIAGLDVAVSDGGQSVARALTPTSHARPFTRCGDLRARSSPSPSTTQTGQLTGPASTQTERQGLTFSAGVHRPKKTGAGFLSVVMTTTTVSCSCRRARWTPSSTAPAAKTTSSAARCHGRTGATDERPHPHIGTGHTRTTCTRQAAPYSGTPRLARPREGRPGQRFRPPGNRRLQTVMHKG
jgi:hypothetical protein